MLADQHGADGLLTETKQWTSWDGT